MSVSSVSFGTLNYEQTGLYTIMKCDLRSLYFHNIILGLLSLVFIPPHPTPSPVVRRVALR